MISILQTLNQLRYDLIGKDSYRGVTLTYSWLANQFGHFSLGYLPTLAVFSAWDGNAPSWLPLPPHEAAAVVVAGAWTSFEIVNFVLPILFSKKKSVFTPKWLNVGFDTFTDIMFFSVGAFTAGNYLGDSTWLPIITTILCIAVAAASIYWYITKMYQQGARFPLQVRLSQWQNTISASHKKTVETFTLLAKKQPIHLLITGNNGSGKTTLAIAIANEIAIQHKATYYTTAQKLISWLYEAPAGKLDPVQYWQWRNARVIIVDDVNPGTPANEEIIQPARLQNHILNTQQAAINLPALQQNSVIWVIGNVAVLPQWQQCLQQLGIATQNQYVVSL
ncbi:MAG: ATP-binding protein [Bacteroidetes bacterium]|nr:MAG: ATP-binding protein [Bacteroidota bacterium]TAF94218.1 MAG: ATP-binding protein [Bacteroidota bacterium]